MPSNNKPNKITIRMYNVCFGDCFLLTFHYSGKKKFHIIMDFGSSQSPIKSKSKKNLFNEVGQDIAQNIQDDSYAIVVSHRHSDHIAGFGDMDEDTESFFKRNKPKLVIQPWTENPDIPADATSAPLHLKSITNHILMLREMQNIASLISQQMKQIQMLNYFRAEDVDLIEYLKELNISNAKAVALLIELSKNKRGTYIHYGSNSGLEKHLKGVQISVLGPPSLEQSEEIKNKVTKHDEFWMFQAQSINRAPSACKNWFVNADVYEPDKFPLPSKWIIQHVNSTNLEQLFNIVTILDKALNNTSVILLFEIGKHMLLFPGDAQIENWDYALFSGPDAEQNQALLKNVTIYKVGHHGSRNATPHTLWDLFQNKSENADNKRRLKTLLSTKPGKHGKKKDKTEVPRSTLVKALDDNSELHSTDDLAKGEWYADIKIDL